MAKMVCLSAGLLFSVMLAVAPAGAAVDCKADPANAACPAAKAAPNSPKPQAATLARPVKPQTAAKGSAPKPLSEPRALGTAKKTGSASGKSAAKPPAVAPAPTRLADRPTHHPRRLTRRDFRREKPLAEEALGDFAPPYPEYRPRSGPVYDMPPGAPPPAVGCDEVCQYRDWLNRYAAWYRDFGRYYYDGGGMPGRPGARPPSLSFNNPPTAAPTQLDQSARDRMDPWHGYNSHNGLGNGY